MGLSFRKSFSFGPMRVNLSQAGVGYSVGIKGARIGVNRRGTYVSLGAGGIQYRKYVNGNERGVRPYNPAPLPQTFGGTLHTITSDDVSQISDVDSQNFIDELTEKSAKIRLAPWGTLFLLAALGCGLFSYFGQITRIEKFVTPKVEITAPNGLKIRQNPDKESAVVGSAVLGTMLPVKDSTLNHWYGVEGGFVSKKFARITQVAETKEHLRIEEHPTWFWICAGFCALLALSGLIYLSGVDRKRLTLEINYEFSDDMAQVHTDFLKAFGHIAGSQKVWQYLHSEHVTDKRRHSGADNSISRVAIGGISLNRKPSAHLHTNVPIPYLGLRNTELFFFPERLVIRRNKQFAAVFYKNLSLEGASTQFIEEQAVPTDATIVGRTWKYLNKNGTPDRRFNGNREIPLCSYSQYKFRSSTGVHEIICTSKNGALDLFTKYVAAIGVYQNRMSIQ
jgi:hypothetical protein